MTIHILKADEAKRLAQRLVQPFVDEVKQKLQAVHTSIEMDRQERKNSEVEHTAQLKEQDALRKSLSDALRELSRTNARQMAIRGEMSVLIARLQELSKETEKLNRSQVNFQNLLSNFGGKVDSLSQTVANTAKQVDKAEALATETKEQVNRNRVIVDRVLKREVDLDNQRIIAKGESDES